MLYNVHVLCQGLSWEFETAGAKPLVNPQISRVKHNIIFKVAIIRGCHTVLSKNPKFKNHPWHLC